MRLFRISLLSFLLLGMAIASHAQLFAPVANPDNSSTVEDTATPIVFSITDNDTDIDLLGGINTASVDLDPGAGGQQTTVSNSAGEYSVDGAGNLSFLPAPDYSGTAILTYTVRDNFTVISNQATITIEVTAVNDAPVITGQNPATTNENQNVTIAFGDLIVTDVDEDDDYPTGFSIVVSAGANYTFTGTTITPANGFSGNLTVHVQVNDGDALSNTFDFVIAVNDTPVINTQNTVTTNEDQAITLTAANLNVIDSDDAYPGTFTMTAAAGPNYTFSGLTITPNANFSGTLTVPVFVNDGQINSNTFNLSVTVTPVNDAPVIATQNAVTTNEGQAVTLTLNDVNVTDTDNAGYPTGFTMSASAGADYTLTGLTVTPNTNFLGTLTVPVQVTDPSGANSNTFNLSITVLDANTAPVIDNQNAVTTLEDQAVTLALGNLIVTDPDLPAYPTGFTMTASAGANYTLSGLTVTPNANFSGTLTVPVRVNDGTANSNIFNLSITVTGVNDAPLITGQDPLSLNEDESITLTLNNLTVTDIDSPFPTGFTLIVEAGANYTFSGLTITPTAGYSGSITVPVHVNDGSANSNTFNLAITVDAVNDLPSAANDATTTTEDTQVSINVVTNDSDTDGTILASTVDLNTGSPGVQGSTTTPQGTFSVNAAGLVTYTPLASFSGTATVQYTVNDNGGGTSNAATLTVTVTAVNDAPVITGQNPLVTNEEQNVIIGFTDLLVTDPDNTYPTGFSITVLAGSNYTFTGTTIIPAANFSGTLTVPVQVSDGSASSATFNVTITVNPVNDVPVITAQAALTTNEDQAITLVFGNLTVSDSDDVYPTGFSLLPAAGANYTVTGLTITPAANFSGTLTVPVQVNDGTANSNTFNLSIAVTAINDAPVITAQNALSLNEDQSITLALGNLTVTDPDNTYPTGFTMTVFAGANYAFTGTTITPTANFSGTLTVPVRVNDGAANSNTFNLSITVTPVNDPPVISAQVSLSTNENQALTIQFGNLTVSDVDNTYPTGFTLNVSGGSNYSVAGTTVTPSANFSGTLTVPVTVNDGTSNSNTFNLTITVNSINDAPLITGQDPLVVTEDQSITLTLDDLLVTDPDNSYPAGFSLTVSAGANYVVSGATVTPAANFSGTLTVPVRVNDGTANSNIFNLSITVTPVNDAPVITGQTALSVNEDTPITLQFSQLLVTDPDNSYSAGFTLTVFAGANYTFTGTTITPAANFTGTLTVPVRVNDGGANSNTFNLSITVNPGNDAPVITNQVALSVNEDNSLTLALGNLTVTDPDNTYPTGFILTVLPGTNYTFTGTTITPSANFSGTLTVPVKVNDGSNDSAPFNLTITVNAVNDAPVITGQQPLNTGEEQTLTLALANLLVSDPDNTYPGGFTLTVFAGTNYTFTGTAITPNSNFTGTLTVPVRVSDGTSNSNIFNLSVSVNGVNDAPAITGQIALSVNEDNAITVLLSQLLVTDPDNSYPAGFALSVSSGANYSVSGNVVTPASNFNGILSVPVTVNDGISNSGSFNLQITVNPVNDTPQITGQNPLGTGEAQAITILLSNLFVFDPDDIYPGDFSLFVLSGANYSVGTGNVVTPSANFSGLLLVKVLVNDGSTNSAIYDLQILVNSVNDPPTITGHKALSVNEDNTINLQLDNLNVSDPDNTYPTGFTLTVLPGANYTFSGTTVTPALNFSGTLTVSVKVNDGISDSAPANVQITVNPVNDAPVITGQQPLAVNEDLPITIQFANLLVVDPDNTYPTGFVITVLAGTNYTFAGNTITPSLNFNGTLTVPVRVSDGTANSNTFNLQIDVDPVNDAPVIASQVGTLTTPEDTQIVIKFADLTVSDPDDTYPTGFTLTVAPGTNYTASGAAVTPALNFNGTLSVNVTVNDGSANSATFQLQILVNPINTPPAITGQVALTTPEDQTITVKLSDLTVNDPDNTYPNGFSLTLAGGANYTVSGATITPNTNFSGNLTVPARVNDGINNSAVFNLLVKVNPLNDAPTITGQSTLTINEDQALTLVLANLTVTDPDNTYPTGFSLIVNPGTNYTVSGSKITPALNFSGNLSVNVVVSDGTDNSAVFVLLVKVNPVNDPPTSSGVLPSTIEEDNTNEIVINLLNGFKDVEDASNQIAFQIQPGYTASLFQSIAINQATGELRYKANPNAFGTTNVTIRATDTGGLFVQDVLAVTISGVNDAPSFDLIADQNVIENSAPQTITLKSVTKGPFENTQSLNLFATSGNTTIIANPVIVYDGVSSQAQLTYTIQPNKSGTVEITIFAIDDGSNTLPNRNSFSSTFDINVVEVNNPPTLDAITAGPIQEDAAVLSIPLTGITAGAGENQTLTVTATHNKTDIVEALEVVYTSQQNTGTLKVTPKANGNGTVQITVTVTDSGPNAPQPPNFNSVLRTFNLVVQPVNDLPVFDSSPVLSATVGEAYNYAIAVTDVDNATIALTALQKPAWATLTVQANGKTATLSGTPPANAAGSSIVRIQAKDAAGSPVIQEFPLVVNTLPVLSQIELTTIEDISIVFQQQKFTAAFADADLNPIDKIKIVSLPNPDLGVLVFNGSAVATNTEIAFADIGNLVYELKPDTAGIDTIVWNASDGLRYATINARIRIVIAPTNDAPVIDSLESDPLDPLEYNVGSGPQVLTEIFWASDADRDSLESAVLGFRIQNYEPDLDAFVYTATTNITGDFNVETGTLSLTGKAPASEYIQFIRSVQYTYSGESLPGNNVKTVYFTLSDGKLLSETKDRFISLEDKFEDPQIISGFTPNSGTENETWLPIRTNSDGSVPDDYKNAEIKVYDKRGRLLFETIGFAKAWDGTYQGELLPADAYFFTLDLKLPFLQKKYQGVVTILR